MRRVSGMSHAAGRLLLLLAGAAAGLLLCEGILRATGYEGDRQRLGARFEPRFGTVPANSWSFGFGVPPEGGTVLLRGRSVPVPKPRNELRVLFVGDSGTEGAFVPPDQSFPFAFQDLLGDGHRGRTLRAINAGVHGMTTADELHFLTDRLLPLEPDVVVLGLFMSNDINFNLGHKASQRSTHPRQAWIGALTARSALGHFLFLKSMTLNNRYKWFRSDEVEQESWIPLEVRLVDRYGFHMLNYPAGEVATYMKRPSPLIERAFEALQDLLSQFQALGDERGFAFRVVLIPSPSSVAGELRLLHYPDIHGELRRQGVEVDAADLDVSLPTRRVLDICKSLELICVDPTARMREIGMRVFFSEDEHPSPLGHQVIAEALRSQADVLLAGQR